MKSCLYEGRVHHRRWDEVEHAFRFPLFMIYLDLEELTTLFHGRWLWSTSRPALARFRREDHIGDPGVPLDTAVRDLVQERRGRRPRGPIRLLTHLRHFGYIFNPVSFYYCFESDGRTLEALVAAVTNTPWQDRHCYVIGGDGERGRKEFHVSPFQGMDAFYRWRIFEPGDSLRLGIESHRRDGARLFDATLAMRRVEISGRSLVRALLRYPLMTVQVSAGIYWQAWRLHRKGAPRFPHPGRPPQVPMKRAS